MKPSFLQRGLLALLLSEVFLNATILVLSGGLGGVIDTYGRYDTFTWSIKLLTALGVFVAGAFNGALNAPVHLIVLGSALVPIVNLALIFVHMDTLTTPGYFLWLVPLCITIAAATPTVLYWTVRRNANHSA